jgi:hypothetical protein
MKQEVQPNTVHFDKLGDAYDALQGHLRRSGTMEHINTLPEEEAQGILQQLWLLSMNANILINRYQAAQLPERRSAN